MPLRTRLVVIFLAVLTTLATLHAGIFVSVVRPGFLRLEQAEAERDLRRIREAVSREADDLDLMAGDWADWDDTYAFVKDGNDGYRASNLVPTVFSQIRIHLLVFLDRHGRAVWHGLIDPADGSPLAIAELPAEGLAADHPLLRVAGHADPLAGLVRTAKGPMLLSARPIRYSDQSGPSAGTLLMGRFFSERLVSDLSRLTQLDIAATTPEALQADQPDIAGALDLERPAALEPLPQGGLRGHVLMPDLFGQPALVLSAVLPHDLSDGARRTILWSFAGAGLAGLVLLVVLLAMTRRLVVLPLGRLSRHLAALRETGDLSARAGLRREDEIGDLADAFDRLAEQLEVAASERDRAQAQLLDGIHSIADGFALWDADDRLVLCNEHYPACFPLVADLIVPGARFADIAAAAVQRGQLDLDAGRLANWVAGRVAQHRSPGAPVEYRMGDGRWLEIRERPTQDGGVVGIYVDVTGRKNAEHQLRATVQELERSNTDLEQFAYIASHDLQEPLRQVASYTQLLERHYGPQLDDNAREFIRYAVTGARRMRDQVNDLLAYARVNRQDRAFGIVDSGEALRTALANLHTAITSSGAQVHAGALPAVRGDRALIVQLFQNLVGNAVKYAKTDIAPDVLIEAVPLGGHWRFSVSDNGIGMDERYADRIFRIFQRLHSRDQYDGTGIGLAICKRIIERHDGDIWVESVPDEGSTFYFTLPAAVSPADLKIESAS